MGNTRNTGYLQNIVQYDVNNNIILPSLTGTGSRMVISSSTGLLSTQAIPTLTSLGGVPTSRTLTIDGVSYDLSANRTWSIIPVGGAAGDILAKNSATNYDLAWIPNFTSTVKHVVKAAVAVTAGQAVYVSSADGTNMIVSKASNASEQTSSKTLGLVAQNLAINGQGFVITEGLLAGLNTSTANAGDPVWLGTDGNLIYGLLNKPVAPAHLVFIGVVTRVQTNNGEIFVKVQNGFELDELHDLSVKNASDGDMIKYVASTGLWTKIAATTTNITEGTNLYYTDARVGTYLSANSYATQSFVSTQINNLIAGAPNLLNTLDELAAALNDDANFATTVTTSLAGKQASLSGTGFVKISGTTISYDNSTYLTTSSASSSYVPYTGATANVSLGNYDLGAKYITSEGSAGLGGVVNIKQDAISMPKGNTYSSIASGLSSFDFYGYTGASTYKYFTLRFDGLTNNTLRAFTLPDASGTIALTSNLSAYLPLSGGTLTGALGGTSATFSGTINGGGNLELVNASGPYVLVGEATGANQYGVTDWDAANNVLRIATQPYAFGANGGQLNLTTGGNVLIGTTNTGADGLNINNQRNLSFSEGSSESYVNIFRQRNSAALVMGAGYKRSLTDSFASSFSSTMARAAIAVGYNNGSIAFFTDGSSTVANGTNITPTERVTILNNGNLGIGSISPGYKFVVNESTSNPIAYFGTAPINASSRNATIILQSGSIPQNGSDTTGEAGFIFQHSFGTGGVNGTANGGYIESVRESVFGVTSQVNTALVFGTSTANTDNERMRLTSVGRLGVGTSNPATFTEINRLFATGSTQIDYLRLTSSQGGAWFSQLGLQFRWNDFGNGAAWNMASILAAPSWNGTTTGGGDLIFSTKTYASPLSTEPTEKVRITSAGSVGINSVSPRAILAIEQDITTTAEFGSFGQFNIGGKTNTNKNLSFGFNTATDVGFIQAMVNGTSYNNLLLNARGGNVGVGTTNPLDTFHVIGSSRWGSAANNLVSFADGGGVYIELTGTNSNQRQLRIQGINNGLNRYSSIRLEAGIEEIAFTTADTERMRIRSNGAVMRQHQPSFLAHSESSGFTVTAGSWYNISNALTVESYDIGSNYSGGRFTAPVAGRYFFYAGGWAQIGTPANGERYAFSAQVNGSGLTFISGGNYAIGDTPLAGYTVVYNLAAGDYVDLLAFTAVGGTWGSGTHRVYWGGYLL